MRRTLMALVALALAGDASAADLGWSLSGELANVHNADPSWDLFSSRDGMPSRGLRAGLKVGPHVTAHAGWQRISRGADVRVPTFGGTGKGVADVRMAFLADAYALGAQVALPLKEVVAPYASVDGMVLRGVMKLDEDTETRENLGQVVGSGFSPGVSTTGGLELRSPMAPAGWQAAVYLEGGWSWFARGDYGAFGQMQPGGLVVRGGLGLRFR